MNKDYSKFIGSKTYRNEACVKSFAQTFESLSFSTIMVLLKHQPFNHVQSREFSFQNRELNQFLTSAPCPLCSVRKRWSWTGRALRVPSLPDMSNMIRAHFKRKTSPWHRRQATVQVSSRKLLFLEHCSFVCLISELTNCTKANSGAPAPIVTLTHLSLQHTTPNTEQRWRKGPSPVQGKGYLLTYRQLTLCLFSH